MNDTQQVHVHLLAECLPIQFLKAQVAGVGIIDLNDGFKHTREDFIWPGV
jgi:hypothetical protein